MMYHPRKLVIIVSKLRRKCNIYMQYQREMGGGGGGSTAEFKKKT